MQIEQLTAESIRQAELRHSTGLEFQAGVEEWHTREVRASFRGNPIRVQYTETEGNPDYRLNVSIYDAETGEHIATGNGDRDWEGALSIVHWQNLNMRWPE
ncbi:hypothetical protein HD600_000210 [Microbacterium ginsengiterrae]|uniref:Uncharacterized protein n=1 Tax=Microbacterium ginsengiterrae TaxID=546115 RepID=A0A7W9C9V4_9MICO|nr:hypothetical protein [Microbacterium ginsengiterrae]MBB5741713.1 hypothetical protein [Microbacterium ginsengiterrae]